MIKEHSKSGKVCECERERERDQKRPKKIPSKKALAVHKGGK